MTPRELTCEQVREGDLDVRYLAGTLPDEEAAAFEAHYFGCDRCWADVQRGLEARAAFADPPQPEREATPLVVRRRSRARPWWPVAAAAALLVAVIGTWQVTGSAPTAPSGETFRGEGVALPLILTAEEESVNASWAPAPLADIYRVRLLSADGTLLWEGETGDTVARVPLPPESSGATMFVEVQALDVLRQVAGRSDPQAVTVPVP